MIKKGLLFCSIMIGCLSFTNPFSYERIIDSSSVLDDLLEVKFDFYKIKSLNSKKDSYFVNNVYTNSNKNKFIKDNILFKDGDNFRNLRLLKRKERVFLISLLNLKEENRLNYDKWLKKIEYNTWRYNSCKLNK